MSQLATQQVELEQQLAAAEAEVKRITKDLRDVAENKLPEALLEAGVSEFTLADGTRVGVAETLYCSVPKKRLDEVIEWLRQTENAAMVRQDVVLSFDKEEDEQVQALVELLRESPWGNRYSLAPSVNTTSLKKLIREMREEGEDVPMELLGAYIKRASVVKLPG